MTLKLLLPSLALVIAASLTAQPLPDAAAPRTLLGKIEEGRYHSPTGAFNVAIPALGGERPVVMDNPEIVVFKDNVRILVTIAAFRMPPLQKWELETTSAREYLIKFFRDYVMADYVEAFPESTVQSARLISDLEGGTLLVYTLHPGGSAFEVDLIDKKTAEANPPVALRGNLLFCRGEHVLVIATELAERVTESSTYVNDAATEDRILRERLLDIHSQMQFAQAATDK